MLLQPCNTGCCNLATQASNPIGLKRKEHKYGVLLGRIINLPKHIRDAYNGLLLLGLYSMKHVKDYGGITRMIAGVHQETGEVFDEISFVAEMNALLQGVDAEIPDDINGGMMPITLEVVSLDIALICSDALALARGLSASEPFIRAWTAGGTPNAPALMSLPIRQSRGAKARMRRTVRGARLALTKTRASFCNRALPLRSRRKLRAPNFFGRVALANSTPHSSTSQVRPWPQTRERTRCISFFAGSAHTRHFG